MADQKHKLEGRLPHKKAPNFINEYVDRFSITNMLNGGEQSIAITMGRDVLEIVDELVSEDGLQPHREGFEVFRRNVATVTIPVAGAKALVKAIMRQLEPQDGEPDSPAKEAPSDEQE